MNNNNNNTGKPNTVIIVNGREKEWDEKEISFKEVIVLAFGSYDNNSTTCYTVTYTRGNNPKPQGSLVEGESINVKHKMIFNVSATDKS